MLLVAIREGCVNDVIEDLKKAVSLNPKYAAAYAVLGILYEEIGQVSLARDSFKKVIAIDPNGPSGKSAREHLQNLR